MSAAKVTTSGRSITAVRAQENTATTAGASTEASKAAASSTSSSTACPGIIRHAQGKGCQADS
jgi:ABC-type branched-subunit amino acid transport system permease subunit